MPVRSLLRTIAAAVMATVVFVPAAARAQHRLPKNDLAHHDPIPLRLKMNWLGETSAAKLGLTASDDQHTVPPVPVVVMQPGQDVRWSRWHVEDERVPIVPVDRSPQLFRGPPPPSFR